MSLGFSTKDTFWLSSAAKRCKPEEFPCTLCCSSVVSAWHCHHRAHRARGSTWGKNPYVYSILLYSQKQVEGAGG